MDKIEFRKIGSLHVHPKNTEWWGNPTKELNYKEICEDIAKRGIQEPLIIKDDGTILSGNIRYAGKLASDIQKGMTLEVAKEQLVPVRIHPEFESEADEILYLLDANIKR